MDNFFEWKAIKGAKVKQPYAIGMQSGEPFALAAIWENWKRPGTSEWVRTFCVITCPANELVADIHDRMPVKPSVHVHAVLGRRDDTAMAGHL